MKYKCEDLDFKGEIIAIRSSQLWVDYFGNVGNVAVLVFLFDVDY